MKYFFILPKMKSLIRRRLGKAQLTRTALFAISHLVDYGDERIKC